MSGDLRSALERRRGVIERARVFEGGMWTVEGFIQLVGVGEATVDVVFPVTFTQMPTLASGGYMADNQAIVVGAFPEWKIDVRRWDTIIDPAHPNDPWYRGANLVVVLSGAANADFRSVAWYRATGSALTNPTVGGL